MTWKRLALFLALVCCYQTWRSCGRSEEIRVVREQARAECATSSPRARFAESRDDDRLREVEREQADEPEVAAGPSINGFKLPAWTLYFAPQPGESMLSYRDRMLPLAQAAVAPHRARVARSREDLAKLVALDTQQRAQLDASVQEAATAIQDKVLGSLLAGELSPRTFKPMTGVALARDVLDSIDQANRKFMATLREDQRSKLAQHPFDFADYLLFSARWEDALGVTN